MKNWNLWMLRLEFALRSIALYMGSILSIILLYGVIVVVTSSDKRFKEFIGIVGKEPIAMSIVYNVFFIVPLLISIFILLTTRRFKEINQLIEENKKL